MTNACVKMMKIIFFITLATNSFSGVDSTKCYMNGQNAKHSKSTKYDVFSDHSIKITNNSGGDKTWHIAYKNMIEYTAPYYTPNAIKEFDVTLRNGDTFTDQQRINEKALFSLPDSYKLRAQTQVSANGKMVASCINDNQANIF